MFVTGAFPPMKCGVGAYTQKLAHALALSGDCKVLVLTDKRASEADPGQGVEIHPQIRGWSLPHLMRTVREVWRLRPDVVHFQYPTKGYSGRGVFLLPEILRWMGFPCVQTWHEPVLGRGGVLLALGLDALIVVKKDIKRHQPAVTNWMLRNKKMACIPGASMLPFVSVTEEERRGIKRKYAPDDAWLLVFYGFLAPLKGLETLLDLVAQTQSMLVLACDVRPEDAYHQTLLTRIDALQIGARVRIAGFLPDTELAMLLASADAAVFPFREGAADWNTSIDGAIAQGVFVLTTTKGESGYDIDRHIFYGQVGAVDEMKVALQQYAGSRVGGKSADAAWSDIAAAHKKIYKELSAR